MNCPSALGGKGERSAMTTEGRRERFTVIREEGSGKCLTAEDASDEEVTTGVLEIRGEDQEKSVPRRE